MPRYELAGDVWQIEQTGAELAITSAGKTTVRKFQTSEQAAAQLGKLVDEHVAAGYRPAGDPRHLALEAAIASEPDLALNYSVYADWLQSLGDPRGALIALQLSADASGDPKLASALAREQKRNAAYLLGPLAPFDKPHEDVPTFEWRYGFIRRAYLSDERHRPIATVLELLLRHPSGRFLVDLTLLGRERMQAAIGVLADLAPASLRTVRMWQVERLELAALWQAMPRLRRLSLTGHALALGTLDLPELERLELVDDEASAATSRMLARARLPALRQLELDFGDGLTTGDASIDDIFEMVQRSDFPALTHLALRHTRYIRELILELPASPVAAQLTILDLSYNHMTDAHALALVRHRDRFPRLASLDVSYNELSDAGLTALATMCSDVRSLRQDVALVRR